MGLLMGLLAGAAAATAAATTLAGETAPLRAQVVCGDRAGWTFTAPPAAERQPDGTEVWRVAIDRESPAAPPTFEVIFHLPQVDIQHVWSPGAMRFPIDPDWLASRASAVSELARGMPVYALFNDTDTNRAAFACSEVVRPVRFHAGVREEDSTVRVQFRFFEQTEAPLAHWEAAIRIDRRAAFWSDAVAEASAWATAASGSHPQVSPPAAYAPLYSSWYCFHQNVTDKGLEEECARAAALGMKTLIVDDGWQTDDNNRGYAFCGDWEISTNRFPDMAAHVARVQALGLKYMMWYGVPFAGVKSKAYARFKGKFIRQNNRLGTAILDPRFPEVRDYIAGLYERAVKAWNLDGFKLDFIDDFKVLDPAQDPARTDGGAGRDFKTVPDATDCLMTNITARLRALKPDVLIEFRQNYIGPKIRQYGNMLRAADCPGDMQTNRARIFALRLTSGSSAVHADMLEWHPDETPESAARYILNCTFATVQYSMMLRRLSPAHTRMIRHWIAFQTAHLDTLQKGRFRAFAPQNGWPLATAESAAERITCVYSPHVVCDTGAPDRTVYVLNATATGRLTLRLPAAPVRAEAFDTFGDPAGARTLAPGLNDVPVPESGYLKLTFAP